MNENHIVATDKRGVTTITLNRPEVHNAFDDKLIGDLTQTLKKQQTDANVYCIVIAGSGRIFSAGADLNWMQRMAAYSNEENYLDSLRLGDLLYTLHTLKKPTVVRIQGAALGGGVGLTAACDMAVATDTSVFSLSEVRLGLIPAMISPYVIRAIGERAARRYFLTAEQFDAREAHRLGLVHSVCSEQKLDDTVAALVDAVLRNGPNAVVEAKLLIEEVSRQRLTKELIEHTAKRISDVRASAEGKEGVSAFLEKRKPSWLGHGQT